MVISKAIRGRREQAFLSLKFGLMMDPAGRGLGIDGRPESVRNFTTYSLRRLGVDVIDMYVPGRPDSQVPYEETIGAVSDLIKQGYVRYLGVSEVGVDYLRHAQKVHPVTALEIEYSLACRFIEPEILPAARELGIGTVAYRVLADGLLTGNVSKEPQGHIISPRMQGDNLKRNLKRVELLEAMASTKGFTVAQLSIAWLLTRGADILPIVGTNRRIRLSESLKALEVHFEPEELELLDQSFPNGSIIGDRYPSSFMHLQAK